MVSGDDLVNVLVCVHDLIITGSSSLVVEKFISQFKKVFALKDLGNLSFFLGIEVKRSEFGVYLSQ